MDLMEETRIKTAANNALPKLGLEVLSMNIGNRINISPKHMN